MPAAERRRRIGVLGSGEKSHAPLSRPLGTWLARQGYDLINGGGGGVMETVARAFSEVSGRPGQVIGILPSAQPCRSPAERQAYQAPEGYPNPYVDLAIRTHLPLSGAQGKELASRNHIIVLSSDFLIALPGSHGTRSEIELALEYGKPLVLLSPAGEWNDFAGKAPLARSLEDALPLLEQKARG